ncbi:MAG: DUF2087 domain-containing protein [Defluviitaleaceae bacterium]|nr:DUF2087 domain-containing protein [Defluviitaleaceae bacterium]
MELADIKQNLQKDGKITRWPKKHSDKTAVIEYMNTKFSHTTKYTEREVNEIIKSNILFDDFALIRRELIDRGFLERTRDCKEYSKKSDIL